MENSAVAAILEKVSFHSNPKERQAKEYSNYHTIALISHTSKVIAQNSSKPGFNSMWTVNLQMFKLELEKTEEPEIKLPASAGSQKKQESSKKTSTSALLTTPNHLCGSQQTLENSSRDGNTRPPDLPPEKPVCRSGSNS